MSISNYYKQSIFTSLHNEILNENIKRAMYWTSEIVASGYFNECWEFCFHFYSMYIHIYHPSFIEYLHNQFKRYVQIRKSYDGRYIELRNNTIIREQFFQIIFTFCKLPKQYITRTIQQSGLFPSFHSQQELITDSTTPIPTDITDQAAQQILYYLDSMNEIHRDNIANATTNLEKLFRHAMNLDQQDPSLARASIVGSKRKIYELVSYLFERGIERFSLYLHKKNTHLEHCQNENKYSYFIWIMWNILLKETRNIPMFHNIMKLLYRTYMSYENQQSINAYMLLFIGFAICLEPWRDELSENITTQGHEYINSKKYYYQTYGYIQEALKKGRQRRDVIP